MGASDSNPQYFCPLRDEFINIIEADLLVVSRTAKSDLPTPGDQVAQANMTIRRAFDDEGEDVKEICRYFWNETEFHCFGMVFDVDECVNVLAVVDGEIAGLLSYKKMNDTFCLVVLNVYPEYQGQGVARRLLQEVMEQALKQGCKKIQIATSNDDLPALCLYQKMGFHLAELIPNIVAEHHGEVINGFAGIPVRDEIRMEREL
ncbi:hypothetical protein CEE37_00625 [candidate division LCP-89 bacterium B3_LCP]|uniref:N-acetyltransferase domain-containing protein n=1 Tax=candidate division LCP-89 bacterium B3_LCP TaxID=2012998 RepID=A0A532V4T3_UNCL8|nr:MAG: hypothetical protein CEE37_00625 [candidate division LCP-89 bacterium B3_LCP]